MVRERFFEIPGGQIHIFVRFLACPLCGFDAVLGCSLAFLGGSWDPSGAPKVALGASRGVPRERVPRPGGSRGLPKPKISVLKRW